MKTTFKVAELATFIYAILVFGSMCIEMAYFSSFDISIAAYLQFSEILFLFLSKPYMYLPLILMLISMPLTTLYTYNDSNSKTASIKERYKAFSSFSYSLIITNSAIIFITACLCEVPYSFGALFSLILPLFVFIFRNPVVDYIRSIFNEGLRFIKGLIPAFIDNILKAWNKPKTHESTVAYKLLTYNTYKKSKERYLLTQQLCSNSFIYGVLVSYSIVVVGLSLVNLTRAKAYIDNELSPKTQATITTISDESYVCDNNKYLLISESAGYIFIFDRNDKASIIIPRNQVLKTSYSLRNKVVMSNKKELNNCTSKHINK